MECLDVEVGRKMDKFLEAPMPSHCTIIQMDGEQHIKFKRAFVGRLFDYATHGYRLVVVGEDFSDGTSLAEYPLGKASGQDGIIGSFQTCVALHEIIIEDMEEGGIGYEHIGCIALFVVFQDVIFHVEEGASFDDVLLADGSFAQYFLQCIEIDKGSRCSISKVFDFTHDDTRPVSIHTMRIHVQFAVDVSHENDATRQAECQT